MPLPVRLFAAAAFAIAAHGAAAQTAVPPVVVVQQLAPQISTFTGSPLNFQSLVNGLAQGAPVQLVTVLPNGFTQVVTFTPTAALAPAEIARTLETARQQLIGLGIGAPTAEQLAFTLMGGVVPTALGGAPVSGVLNTQSTQNPPSPAEQMQRSAATGAPVSTSPLPAAAVTPAAPAVTSSVNVQFIPSATTGGTTATGPGAQVRNTSDSSLPAGSTSFSPATGSTSTTPVPGAAGAASAPPTAAPERATTAPRAGFRHN